MDTNRNTSIVFFIMMGLGFIATILYVFVFAPKRVTSTLGSADLALDLPVQKWNLRYLEEGVVAFCEDDNTALVLEVADDTDVYSASEGVVVGVTNNIIKVEVLSGIYVEYSPITNHTVFKGDYITKGDRIGKVKDNLFSLRVNNTKMKLYECPYTFLNDFAKSIVDESMNTMGYTNSVCGCASISY